jgi:starvation-inducible DNA-binding protein
MQNTVSNKTYDLEYNRQDKAEIIIHLNEILANYQLYFHKLRIFRWNVVGREYFDLQNQFMNLQEKAQRNIDEIAERIRIFDQTPLKLLNDYIKSSKIKENGLNLTAHEMVQEVLGDMLTLLSLQEDCMKMTIDLQDYGTEKMLKDFIYETEKDHKMLLSWLK